MTNKNKVEEVSVVEPDTSERVLLVERGREPRLRLVIPTGWKVTFSVAGGKFIGTDGGLRDLRIYEGQSCRAVFTGVTNFYDVTTVKVERETKATAGARQWTQDEDGYHVTEHEDVKRGWAT